MCTPVANTTLINPHGLTCMLPIVAPITKAQKTTEKKVYKHLDPNVENTNPAWPSIPKPSEFWQYTTWKVMQDLDHQEYEYCVCGLLGPFQGLARSTAAPPRPRWASSTQRLWAYEGGEVGGRAPKRILTWYIVYGIEYMVYGIWYLA